MVVVIGKEGERIEVWRLDVARMSRRGWSEGPKYRRRSSGRGVKAVLEMLDSSIAWTLLFF